jgi:hypothetical protein
MLLKALGQKQSGHAPEQAQSASKWMPLMTENIVKFVMQAADAK